jgi:uncharacterized protein
VSRWFLLFGPVLMAACSAASEPSAFPYFNAEGGRVRDMANLLTAQTEASLTARLHRAKAMFGPQMAIVTVTSLEGYDIADFSLEYARAWGLGDKERNDGLQLMVAPNERKVRIEVGKGIEETFTDVYCAEVIEDIILPHFREGRMEEGIVAGTEELIEHMRRNPTIQLNDNAPVDNAPVDNAPVQVREAA